MNLENLNLVELNAQEIEVIDGGNPYVGWVVAGLAWDILSSPSASYHSFMAGFNAQI